MNYEAAIDLRAKYLHLINTNTENAVITDIVVLPAEEGTLLAYTGHIKTYYPIWEVTSFDHEFIYKKSGIYILYDGRVMPDNLTLYALVKYVEGEKKSQYKCELLYNILAKGGIAGTEGLPPIGELLK